MRNIVLWSSMMLLGWLLLAHPASAQDLQLFGAPVKEDAKLTAKDAKVNHLTDIQGLQAFVEMPKIEFQRNPMLPKVDLALTAIHKEIPATAVPSGLASLALLQASAEKKAFAETEQAQKVNTLKAMPIEVRALLTGEPDKTLSNQKGVEGIRIKNLQLLLPATLK